MLARSMAAARLARKVVCRAQLSVSRAISLSTGSRWPRLGGIVGQPGTRRVGSAVIPGWSALQGRWMSSGDTVKLHIVEPSGHSVEVIAKIGESILDIAREKDLELEGACEGTLACSTCHCVFEKELFDQLPPPEEEELDMLDLAAALTETSRLGCQVKVTKAFEGAKIVIPDEFNDMQGDLIDESK